MIPEKDGFLLALFIIFVISAAVQLWYYLRYYLAPVLAKPLTDNNISEPVSVIICARNESVNLKKFLPSVLGQDYPSYEVIVVNDCSDDRTDDVLGELLLNYPNLKVSSISKDPRFTHNKKFAQFIGIRAAANDILLFTDADCEPVSKDWIRLMASNFRNGTEFVLGYGGYFSEKGLLNAYIRYDTMFIAMQYLGMAIRGCPYMGVGRNLAYRKEVFFRNRGFGAHNHVLSGDDDLFVNANSTAVNTRAETRPGSHTRSVPAGSAADWVKQKQRHLTTGRFYKMKDKARLIAEPLSRMTFYILFAVLLSFLYLWPVVLALFGLRLIAQVTVTGLAGRKLNERRILFISLFFDIFSPLLNASLYASTIGIRQGKLAWK